MKYLKYVRIDERLIHGQVLIKWLKENRSNAVIIVDNILDENPILKSVMQKSLPQGCQLEVFGCEAGIEFLKKTEFRNLPFILIRDVAMLEVLEKAGIMFEQINIARLPYAMGKDEICEKVYMDKKEQKLMRRLMNSSRIYVQMVPDSEVVWLKDVL